MFRFEDNFGPADVPLSFAEASPTGDGKDFSHPDFRELSSARTPAASGSHHSGDAGSTVLFRYRVTAPVGFEHVREAMIRTTGHSAQDFYTNPQLLEDLAVADDRVEVSSFLKATPDVTEPIVVRLHHRQGSEIALMLSRRNVVDEEGRLVSIEVRGREVSRVRDAQTPDATSSRLGDMLSLSQDALGVLQAVRDDDQRIVDFSWSAVSEQTEQLLRPAQGSLNGLTVTESFPEPEGTILIGFLSDRMSAPGQAATCTLGDDLIVRAMCSHDLIILHLEHPWVTLEQDSLRLIQHRIDAMFDEPQSKQSRLGLLCEALLEVGADFALALLSQVNGDEPMAVYRTSPGSPILPVIDSAISVWRKPRHASTETSESGMYGREVEILSSTDDQTFELSRATQIIEKIAQIRPSSLTDSRLRGADGEFGLIIFGTDQSSRPLSNEQQRMADFVTRSITLFMENHELRDEVRSIALVREEFLSIVAHEIKTPLTGIHGYGQLLERYLVRDEPDIERARRAVDGLQTQIERFRILANDLLDATRVSQGHLALRLERTSFNTIAAGAIERVMTLEPSLGRTINLEGKRPLHGVWDAARIDQVLYILLSNAVNYSTEGEILLAARQEEDEAVITVTDQGVGIVQEDLHLLFQPFSRGRSAHGLSTGAGLGLYLAREIIRRHGGQISLRSQPHAGTTVTIRLPLNAESDVTDDPG